MFKKQALLPVILSFLVSIIIVFMAYHFSDIYESFDASVPLFTQMIINNYFYILILPLATIVGIYFTEYNTNNRRIVVVVSLILSIILSQLLIWHLYLPIYQLAA